MLLSSFWSRFAVALTLLATVFLGLSGTSSAQDAPKPIRALLVIGGCCHDYGKQKDIITKGISARANVQWVISYDPDTGTKHMNPIYGSADWAKNFDVIVHDECCADVKDMEIVNRILEPHRQGLPGVVLHCAMHSYRTPGWDKKETTPWFEFTGLQTTGHGAQQPIALSFLEKDNPITKGQTDWSTIKEELYNNITGKLLETAQPLIRGKQGKSETIVAWTNNYMKKSKVFGTTLGHNNATVEDARYLDLLTRGLLWTMNKLDPAYLTPAKSVMLETK
jgi:type 1 glutamine amidotransferase